MVGITVVMMELAHSTELVDAPLMLPSLDDAFELIELPKLLAALLTTVKLVSLVVDDASTADTLTAPP